MDFDCVIHLPFFFVYKEFEQMAKTSTPELLRSNLSSVILQLLSLNVNALTFDFIDKPPNDVSNFHQIWSTITKVVSNC